VADAVDGDQVTEIGTWSGQQVSMGAVLDALTALRHQGERTATRTSVVTLVALADDADEVSRACNTTAGLGGRHPGRTVVVHAVADGTPSIDAQVRLLAGEAEGVHVWSEDVVLTVHGPAVRHLDSLIEPITLPDLPVACWYVGAAPAPDDPLAETADVVLVDGKELAGDLGDLLELTRRRTVIDLSWVRLTPWRLLLAGLFEGRAYRPYVTEVNRAEVRGKPGPRHLLGGWLAECLHLPDAQVHLEDARHAAMALAVTGGRFGVERKGEERLVRASAQIEDGPHHEELLALPDMTLAWSLAEALSNLESDPVYERALERAISFAG
jgi:glucose-6-phosphate dehydrogenase assembly protein OpcA